MMLLHKSGALGRGGWPGGVFSGEHGRFELSEDLLERRCTLLDELFAFVFDVLDLRRIEIRVHASEARTDDQA